MASGYPQRKSLLVRWLTSGEKGDVFFECHPWPNTWVTRIAATFLAVLAGTTLGLGSLLREAWLTGAFFTVMSVALIAIGWTWRDHLSLDDRAIYRPKGKYTLAIPFENIAALRRGEGGRIVIEHRGRRWFWFGESDVRERARLLAPETFFAEIYRRIEARCGADFVAEIRSRSGA